MTVRRRCGGVPFSLVGGWGGGISWPLALAAARLAGASPPPSSIVAVAGKAFLLQRVEQVDDDYDWFRLGLAFSALRPAFFDLIKVEQGAFS